MVVLDQVQFGDFETGWVSGHILQTTPKDAFFLLTNDGGKTWRKRPITSEARTGAVEQFWFDSRNHGMLSIDRVRAAENGFRYELWESTTAGESWSVRQVDAKPVSVPRPPREPIMRIVSDNSGKVHRIQRREGPKWVPVATFDVSAGECRPPEGPAAKEPPSDAAPETPESPVSAPVTGPKKPPALRRK